MVVVVVEEAWEEIAGAEVESWGRAEGDEGCAGEHCWSFVLVREEESSFGCEGCAFLVFWFRHVKGRDVESVSIERGQKRRKRVLFVLQIAELLINC